MSKATLERAEQAIWTAYEILRGPLDSTEYINYVLPMFLLKYISDVHRDEYDETLARYKGDEERINRRMSRARFIVHADASFDALYEKRHSPNLGQLVNSALARLSQENKGKLGGVLNEIDFNDDRLGVTSDRNQRLVKLLDAFHSLDLRPSQSTSDFAGKVAEALFERSAAIAGKRGGDFYTPQSIAVLLAELLEPSPGETIFDPACGIGSLLIRAAEETGSSNIALFGQDINHQSSVLARMNMILHGLDSAQIGWGDTLITPLFLDKGSLLEFDVVLSQPPFSKANWGSKNALPDRFDRFRWGVPPNSNADWAFISHMLTVAREKGGRVGVIVPLGVLFRGGAEGRIRKQIIQDNLLDAVVRLPSNLLLTTAIPVALLLFRHTRLDQSVLFIDASSQFERGKKQNVLLKEHVAHIVSVYRARKGEAAFARLVPLIEIAENDYTLSVEHYLSKVEEQPTVSIGDLKAQVTTLEESLTTLRGEVKKAFRELNLS